MTPVAETFQAAVRHEQTGNLRQAEQHYRQCVQADPDHADAWLRLAECCHKLGRPDEAVAGYRNALRLRPDSADACYNLGAVTAELGRPDEAIAHYRQVLRLRPDHADALTSLGVLLAQQGHREEAVVHFRAAIRARPDFAQAHHNLGVALAQDRKWEESADCLRHALHLKPDYAEACCNLANVLAEQHKREEAVALFERALALRPDYVEALNNLGKALRELRRAGEALIYLEHAVRLRPAYAEAHNNLGLAYAELGRFIEAESFYKEALRLNPRMAEAHNNLGSAYKEQGRTAEALASYQLALWLDPQSASTHWNRSLAWLAAGDYAKGWTEYEWRWQRPQTPPRPFRQPPWDGSPLNGRTVLLYMEQGLGDMIQFIRYAPLVKARGGRVVVECPDFLVPLFATCPGIDQLVAEKSPLPEFDVQAPLMSLPRLFGTTLATVPANVPYLTADPERVERWRPRLEKIEGYKVGIVWQGNRYHGWDHFRSFPLTQFEPLARLPGVQLVSLQKDFGTEQLKALNGRFSVTELDDDPAATNRDFLDTAAIMKCLDLVITADTATAHLAGALAVPVWVPLSTVVDWRWLHYREDSPWYPTMRLFRQKKLDDWEEVFGRMAVQLSDQLA